jgi:hypothetical protein
MLPTLWECALSCQTLQRLQCLTYLDVDGLSAENLLQLGGLTSLQELHLRPGGDVATVFGPSSVPGLEFPPFLKQLFLPSYEEDNYLEAALLRLVPARLVELEVKCGVRGPTRPMNPYPRYPSSQCPGVSSYPLPNETSDRVPTP